MAIQPRRRRRLAWIAVSTALVIWPVAPLVVLGASVAEAYAAVRPIERGGAAAAVHRPSYFANRARAAAADLARARMALGWLGDESGWPVVGPADGMVQNAVWGAYDLASQAAAVLGAAGMPAAARAGALATAVVDGLPMIARGLSRLGRVPRWAPLPSPVSGLLRLASSWTPLADELATSRGALSVALGLKKPARYLLLFQDSGELRATGGFLAAYGYVTLRGGRVSLQYGGALTALGNRATAHPAAGPVLLRYFGERRLSLINANDRASGPQSAAAILSLYRSVPGAPPVQGVILVDSWWVDALLKLAGPVSVSGTGATLTAGNAPVELELLAEHRRLPAGVGRMAFLGPVLRTLAGRLLKGGVPAPALLSTLVEGLNSGGVLLEPVSPGLAQLAARLGWSGTLYDVGPHQNYLMVCNQNLGGLKDNLYLTERLAVTVQGRREQVRLTLQLPHPATRANAWMLGAYRGYVTVHVPAGTRLLRMAGGVGPAAVTREAGKTVIGFGVVAPASPRAPFAVSTVTLSLELPRTISAADALLFQNQPGLRPGSELLQVSTPAGHTATAPAESLWVERAPHGGLALWPIRHLP